MNKQELLKHLNTKLMFVALENLDYDNEKLLEWKKAFIVDLIESAKTLDVPIECKFESGHLYYDTCSNCHKHCFDMNQFYDYIYCPYCGRKINIK